MELPEQFGAVLDDYIHVLAAAPLAAQTRRIYTSKVRQYLAWLAGADLDEDGLRRASNILSRNWAQFGSPAADSIGSLDLSGSSARRWGSMIDVPGPYVWAAFSVKDHCVARPFVADVLLYDRLMIPTPPRVRPEDPESPWDPKEVEERWAKWDPQKLERLLRVLCREDRDRATVVPWDERLRERWADKMKGYSAEELLVDANLALSRDRRCRDVARDRCRLAD